MALVRFQRVQRFILAKNIYFGVTGTLKPKKKDQVEFKTERRESTLRQMEITEFSYTILLYSVIQKTRNAQIVRRNN